MENLKKVSKEKQDYTDQNELSAYDILEDGADLSFLEKAAAEATRKAYNEAINSGAEVLVVQDGKLIRKKLGEPDEVISEHEERKVEIGKVMSFHPQK